MQASEMGSVSQNPSLTSNATEKKEITVLVTGFGPFREQYPFNPSWEIAKRLKPFLPPSTTPRSDELEGAPRGDEAKLPAVRILVHPEPVHVGYEAVRKLVPGLWDSNGNSDDSTDDSSDEERRRIDYMIHVGMAGGREYYSIERRGHRDGYNMKDVDRRKVEGWTEDWVSNGGPESLKTDIAIDKVWSVWRTGEGMGKQDLRISEDAGRYLCDFIYYTSLNHLWTKNEKRRVLFLHVPVASDSATIQKGVKILEELIRAVVLVEEGEERKKGGKDAEATQHDDWERGKTEVVRDMGGDFK